MTKNTVNETERMVVTRVFDAPRAVGLEGVDRPEICDAVVGAEGFYCAFLRDGFSRWRKISLLHEIAGWAGVLECG